MASIPIKDRVGRVDVLPAQSRTDKFVEQQTERYSLTRNIQPVLGPNFLRFVPYDPEKPIALNAQSAIFLNTFFAFDSFVVQQVTRNEEELMAIQYTNGEPIVDVFHNHPSTLAISGVIPDTAPFYALEGGVRASGYLGESLEALRTLYEKYFRVSSCVGVSQPIRGFVEFYHKGRLDRGYLIRFVSERSGSAIDHAAFSLDMFVVYSQQLNFKLPAKERDGDSSRSSV